MEKPGVRDLGEKLARGELTREEALLAMKERALTHHRVTLKGTLLPLALLVYFVVLYLPTVARVTSSDALSVFARLPTFDFHPIIKALAGAFILAGLCMTWYAGYLLSSKGGLGRRDETVFVVREGPYKLVRHPIALGMFGLFLLHPIILSSLVSYTILSIFGQIGFALLILVMPMREDEDNVRKWGDEYKRYMKEVPKFNFIKGALELWKKR